MNTLSHLLQCIAAVAKVNTPIFSVSDIALMLRTNNKTAVSVLLHRACKTGLLEKVSNGFYISTLNPPDATLAVYDVAQKMRSNYITYVSLESQLSYTGHISQIPIDTLTMMTTGRSGKFRTTYGTIEFVHTRKKLDVIAKDLYFDAQCKVWRAMPIRAYNDLKSVNRNLEMVTDDIC